MNTSVEEILSEIESLRTDFRACRSYFPFLPSEAIGTRQLTTAPYYIDHGFHVSFVFAHPLTAEQRTRNNDIGDWINQNVIVRLCALMEYHGMFSSEITIDQNIDGWKELDIARRLRQVFAHKSGKFNPDDCRERTLMEEIIRHFRVASHAPERFPLDIRMVIDPIFEGCMRYIRGKLA